MRGFTYARPGSAGEAVEMMTQAAGRTPGSSPAAPRWST